MSPKNSQHSSEAKTNPNLKSSIVHQPFDTGTVNIFNPHRNDSNDRSNTPELFLDEFLEELEEPKIDRALRSIEIEDRDSELNKLGNIFLKLNNRDRATVMDLLKRSGVIKDD